MKACILFKSYRFPYGHDPIIKGINYARLGASKGEMLDHYSHGGYTEEYFEELLLGYTNAYNEEYVEGLNPVEFFESDTRYILKNLTTNKFVRDIRFEAIEKEERRDVGNIRRTINGKHVDYPINFKIEYFFNINSDSSSMRWWHVDVNIEGIPFREKFRKGAAFVTGDYVWNEVHSSIGNTSTSFWYETPVGKTIPHSSDVAKLIDQLCKNFISRYFTKDESVSTLKSAFYKAGAIPTSERGGRIKK